MKIIEKVYICILYNVVLFLNLGIKFYFNGLLLW